MENLLKISSVSWNIGGGRGVTPPKGKELDGESLDARDWKCLKFLGASE